MTIAIILVVPALLVALNMPARNPDPLAVKFACFYGIAFHITGLIGMAALDFPKRSQSLRRFRIRMQVTSQIMLVAGLVILFVANSFRHVG